MDPSLASVETATLTQGVAFLYAQAGELLKRRRDARDRAAEAQSHAERADPGETALPVLDASAQIFERAQAEVNAPVPAALDRLSTSLLAARRDVEPFVLGEADLDPVALATARAVDRLRCLLEEIYGTCLTFRGEQRITGSSSTATVEAEQIGVYISGTVHARDIAGRDITKYS